MVALGVLDMEEMIEAVQKELGELAQDKAQEALFKGEKWKWSPFNDTDH